MIRIEDITAMIRRDVLPSARTRYRDSTWFCVELRRGTVADYEDALIVSMVQIRKNPKRSPARLLELATALEVRARELGIPLVANSVIPKFAGMLRRRGYSQLNPTAPTGAQQTWKRLPKV
jgi:hypothetical protein